MAAGTVAATLMAVRLFLPHPVGMANNGDAVRLLCRLGVDPDAPPKASAKWFFVRFWFPFSGRNVPCPRSPSSQILLLRATAWVHQHVLGLSGAIDLRELAVEYCLLVGFVVAVFAHVTRAVRPLARGLLLCGLFAVLSEAVFADYAASPFSEPAALYGVLVAAVAGAALVGGGYYQRLAFVVAWAAAAFAVGAKNESVTLAIPLAFFLGTRRFELKLGATSGRGSGRARSWWSLAGVADRIVPGLCVFSLAAIVAWNLSSESVKDTRTNFGNEVTMTVMPLSANPSQVATGLGLPASFGRYSGTSWWSVHPIENDPLYPEYADKFTDINLGHYLSQHPALTARVFASGADAYYALRNGYIGTYAADAGYTREAQECRDCLLQGISRSFSWAGVGGILAYWLACVVGAVYLIRKSRPGTRARGFALTALMLIGCTVVQYVTAVYGEGNEVTKHLSIALFAACLAPLWLATAALLNRRSTAALPPVPAQAAAGEPTRADQTNADQRESV